MSKSIKSMNNWRAVVSVVVAVLAAAFIIFNWQAIATSFNVVKEADPALLFLALGAFSLTVFAAAGMTFFLKLKQGLTYWGAALIQTATLFIGKVVPAGVGSIATIARALVVKNHSVVEAGTVMGAISIATFAGNMLLSAGALMFSSAELRLNEIKLPPFVGYALIALTIVAVVLVFVPIIKKKIAGVMRQVTQTLARYKHKKRAIAGAVVLGAIVTFGFALALLVVARALNVEISLFAAIITVGLGSIGVAVTPLPGGAVGAEAALALSLTQFGVPAEQALAIALLYRFITFWLPLAPGFIASQYSLKRKYL